MSTPITREMALETQQAIHEALQEGYVPPGHPGKGALHVAAVKLGMSRAAIQDRVWKMHQRFGIEIDWSQWSGPKPRVAQDVPEPPAVQPWPGVVYVTDLKDTLVGALKKGPQTLDTLAEILKSTRGSALVMLETLQADGLHIHEADGLWSLDKPHPRFNPESMDYVSRDDGTYVFGITSDNHFASKQSRHDVVEQLYDIFQEEGVDRAFNGGNYLEGERDFNRFELTVHGLDAQVEHLVKNFPRRPGITTYAVSGDDHEAWWSQRTGMDIGRKVEQSMRDAGRTDWVNAGFIEADFRLVNAETGKSSILRIVHPGGGSAYAISYRAQKYVESLEGGNKPSVVCFGHWHKMFCINYRGVWCIGNGCTKDQDIFQRKLTLEAHVGGLVIKLKQDKRTGAIVRCMADQIRFFDKGYYENGKWSYAGDVVQPERSIGGV